MTACPWLPAPDPGPTPRPTAFFVKHGVDAHLLGGSNLLQQADHGALHHQSVAFMDIMHVRLEAVAAILR